MLLNWRGKPFSYRTVSFADVFNDMISKEKKRPQDEFTNKIVLIGSTAPSLFDIKATPISRLHPGVEIMATAIDNLKHGDYLYSPEGRILYPLVSLVIVWMIAVAFYRGLGGSYVDRMTGQSQFTLLAVSYASINFTNTYINLMGPFTIGLAYFAVARLYAAASSKALETGMVGASVEQDIELRAFLLLIRVGESHHSLGERKLKQIRRRLEKSGIEPKSVEILTGRQKGIWTVFENTLAVSWVVPAQDHAARERVIKDVEIVTASLKATLPRTLGAGGNGATWVVHESLIAGGKAARTGWDRVLAETQLRWHEAREQRGRFSEEEEIAIGRQAAGNLLGAAPLINDVKLQRYVNAVGRWIASQSERSQLKWRFGVIDSTDINAFAAPGGYIFVTKGLYGLLRNESDLAGVLAHEIGHVIHKHDLKLLQQSRLVEGGSKILGKAAGENQQIKNLIGNGAEISSRSLDKDAEFEADRTAVVLAARAGYDAFGLPAVLQDIGRWAKDESSVALLFKTHPHPDERLVQLEQAIRNRLDSLKGATLEKRFYRLRP